MGSTRHDLRAEVTRSVTANGISLCCATYGDPADPPLLMIMGIGTQLDGWDVSFRDDLVDSGFFVIRFDNRDVGLSQRLEGVPDLTAIRDGDLRTLPYTLDDMAADSVGLLDALGIDRAHILGASMGGMVAQLVAIHWPERMLSLCSIMSSTGDPSVGQADPAIMELMRRPAPATRAGVVEAAVERSRALAGSGFPFDEEAARTRAAAAYDRAHDPAGRLRQQAAAIASADRTPALRGLRVPTVAVHGSDDRLVDVSGGQATADAVPGAWLEVVDGMGHGIVPEAWPQIIAAVRRNAARATALPGDVR
ncbi:alpha/beta fold hydrolase [Phytohabitans sp. ZYX-F-186]|uniref:Alpha/beta fold hydrolase n=1 Tax=Phytohabitans maris TaxID=3071409 RepID=A0ABU0ZDY5_9ACTN|nr:alpha/beta fold hydrolase [Phytohabitans sp. ZYX-F-186]MDQ7905264.1 alpha/beta fold hydrolase [Phytohabitans sp. ZYX-F-186]